MRRTGMAIAGCLLLACGVSGDPVSGSHASSALTPAATDPDTGSTAQARDPVRAGSASEVSVCHRARERWVPLILPETAVQAHVGNHGDFVYDVSAGQCCTDADCGAGLSCRLSVGLDGESLMGTCPRAGQPGPTDPTAFLLARGLFGAVDGSPPPIAAVLSRATDDQGDHYSLSFPVDGISVHVALASFVPSAGTAVEENSSTPVSVTSPPRNAGLITFDEAAFTSYLNLKFPVTETSSFGTGTVDLINAIVANFTLDTPDNPEAYPVVFLDSGDAYALLGIRGVYVRPVSYIGAGNGPAGFYPGLLNGGITTNVLVFREAVYDVRL